MGVEPPGDDEPRASPPSASSPPTTKPRRPGLRRTRFAAAWLLLVLGCFTQKPSGESAPSSAPAQPAPESPPVPPVRLESPEEKRQAPAAPQADPETGVAGGLVSEPVPGPQLDSSAEPPGRRGGARRTAPTTEAEREDLSRHDRLKRRLDDAYRAGTPDCPSARDRKKAVCDLADQICQLIDRDPNVATVAHYCADAKERCAEAGRRTSQRCPD